MLLLYFVFLINLIQPSIENEIIEQANNYIQAINEGENLSENTWALIQVYQASCSNSNAIQRLVNRSTTPLTKQLIASLPCNSNLPRDEFFQLIHRFELYGLATTILISNLESPYYEEIESSILDSNSYDIPTEFISLFQKISNKESISINSIPNKNKDLILNSIYYTRLNYLLPSPNERIKVLEEFMYTDFITDGIIYSLQLSNAAHYLYNFDRYLEFSRLHDKIITDEYFPISELRLSYSNALAYVQNTIGRYDYSLELHRKVIAPYSLYFGSKINFDQSKLDQGISLYSLGKFSDARDIFETLYYDPTSEISKAQINNNLSIAYEKLGEKNKYIRYLLDALELAENESDHFNTLTILSNLYFYYSRIGDHNSALSYLDRARTIAVEKNDIYQIASIHAITGMHYWKTDNDTEKALEQFLLASTEFNPESSFEDYVRSNHIISDIYIELDSLYKAREVLTLIREVASQNSNGNAFIESTIGLLNIALIEQNLVLAEEYLETIKLYSLDNLDFKTLVRYHILVAEYQFQSGDQRLAYQNLRPVIDQVLDRARTTIDTQTGFWVQEDEYIDAFNGLLRILLSMGNNQEAVQLLDEIKTINDAALYNSPILRANRLTEEELARDQLLNSRIMSLRESFLYANNNDSKFDIKNQIDQLSAEREEILNKIRQNGVIEKTPIWMIQQNLESNEQIVHFTEVGDYLYVSYLSNNEININKITFESSEKALFTDVADQIALSKTNLKDLYDIFDFLGIESATDASKSNMIVIPDNYLYRIPLEILPSENPETTTSYGSATYLIEKFNIEYFASLQEYHSDTRNQSLNFSSDLSAFAISDFSNFQDSYLPTLPFATQEVRSISGILNSFDEKNIFIEKEATKTAFLNEVSNAKIVHIATHSEVSEQDPLFSTIYLNDYNSESNINSLYAYELFDQRLNNELIMLNSCSSGSGNYLQGSGIMGITRALRYAGAKSMALNLWAVNDKVAYEFAAIFYKSLNNGRSKSESMRDAKLSLLQNGNANPHYWGAFMLTGDPSPITKRPDNAGLVFPILLLLIGSVSFYLRKIYSI